jgi:hypothetical protein
MPLILSGSSGLSGNVGTTTKDMMYPGAVLQVVPVVKTDTWAISGVAARSWQSVTGLTASITPLSTTSKILVSCVMTISSQNTYNAMGGRITRNGTAIFVGDTAGSRQLGFFGTDDWYAAAANAQQQIIQFVDSPNSTSAQTYQLQLCNDRDTEGYCLNRSWGDGDGSQTFRCVSTLTLTEIKA